MTISAVRETMVEEWDGELNHVLYWYVDQDVVMQYDDGLTHIVTSRYFDSIRRDHLMTAA